MSAAASSSVNYWPDSSCAKAFWGQHEVPPYRRLLADTCAWLDPQPGERWLDLGCGGGQLTQALWRKSGGRVAEVVGMDCAAVNERAFDELRARIEPHPGPGQIRFTLGDLSQGLTQWRDGSIDGVVSGLAIQYAEYYSQEHQCWTTDAYDHLLAEVYRV